jgi:hypothetical protein
LCSAVEGWKTVMNRSTSIYPTEVFAQLLIARRRVFFCLSGRVTSA